MTMSKAPVFVIGDVHGHLDKLVRLLVTAQLVGSDLRWRGRDAALWFTGDFADRGPDGIGVIDLAMRLQAEAAAAGGQVGALLGNHDVGIVSAYLFPNLETDGAGGTFRQDWLINGGLDSDLVRLQPRHIEWLTHLQPMARVGDRLLIHADALFYEHYGSTIEQVNLALARVLQQRDPREWDRLLGYGGERFAFDHRRTGGVERTAQMLKQYGGAQIIHGHTPISLMTGEPDSRVTHAITYARGQCVDVDGGMYRGGPGFVHELKDLAGVAPSLVEKGAGGDAPAPLLASGAAASPDAPGTGRT